MKKFKFLLVLVFGFMMISNTTQAQEDYKTPPENETSYEQEIRLKKVLDNYLIKNWKRDWITISMDKKIEENGSWLIFRFKYYRIITHTPTGKTKKIIYRCKYVEQKFDGEIWIEMFNETDNHYGI